MFRICTRPQYRAFSAAARRFYVAKPFVLADIGEGIAEVEIVKWMVEKNQKVQMFDPIVEVMSDKATVEISAPFDGTILDMAGEAGEVIKTGSVLCNIDTDEAGTSADASSTPDSAPASQAPTAPAPSSPAMSTPQLGKQDKYSEERALFETSGTQGSKNEYVLATPSTRRLAKEHRISLDNVPGTGKGGRVTKSDVLAHVQRSVADSAPSSVAPATPAPPSPAASSSIPLSPIRRAMAKAMTNSLEIPHFSYSDTIDVTQLERIRLQLNRAIPYQYNASPKAKAPVFFDNRKLDKLPADQQFERITMMPLLVKLLSLALLENPLFACAISKTNDSLISFEHDHRISIALSGPAGGLYTPCISSVNSKNVFDISSSIAHLQNIATQSVGTTAPNFPPSYRAPGTITISNIGVIGGTTTHPVIPPTGQLAIGAIGRSRVVPTYVDEDVSLAKSWALSGGPLPAGQQAPRIEPRIVMDATFSADHRFVEGIELAKLVATWKDLIENPGKIVGLTV